MLTTVLENKIYNLLMSQDLECRLLGLSYLDKDKNNPNLAIRYDLMTSSYYVYDLKSPIKNSYSSFNDIYFALFHSNLDLPKGYMMAYIKYCYNE